MKALEGEVKSCTNTRRFHRHLAAWKGPGRCDIKRSEKYLVQLVHYLNWLLGILRSWVALHAFFGNC